MIPVGREEVSHVKLRWEIKMGRQAHVTVLHGDTVDSVNFVFQQSNRDTCQHTRIHDYCCLGKCHEGRNVYVRTGGENV